MPLYLHYALKECRHGARHFIVLLLCMTLAASVTAAIAVFDATLTRVLQEESQSLLGGDAEFYTRGTAPSAEAIAHIKDLGDDISHIAETRTMLNADGITPVLAELKAVDDFYPLIGAMEVNGQPFALSSLTSKDVIVDAGLTARTGLTAGDTVRIGDADYTIKGIITREPDRGVQLFAFGPRVMLTHEGFTRSNLGGSLSLIRHAYRITAPSGEIFDNAFEDAQEDLFRERFSQRSWGVRIGSDGNRMIDRFADGFFAFLTLSGLATFLIAGAGAYGSVRAFAERKAKTIAVLKSMGASRATVLKIYASVLLALATVAGVAGIIIACAAVTIGMPALAEFMPTLAGKSPVLSASLPAMLHVYVFTFLFAAPILLNARDIPPASLFRAGAAQLRITYTPLIIGVTAALAALTLALFILTARDKILVAGMAAMLPVAFGLIAGCSYLLRYAAKRIRVRTPWLALALGNIARPGSASGAVMFAFGVSLTVLIALTLTESNLRQRITEIVEREAPALFMIDIQPFRKDELQQFLADHPHAKEESLYPMVRGRVQSLNGVPVADARIGEDARWITRGDRGLSYADAPPENADIVQGVWTKGATDEVSVDKRLLEATDLELGDTITVTILGTPVTAKITSAREIDYTGFQINFAMMFSPALLKDFPASYVATVYETPDAPQYALLRDTAVAFPEITIISTREIVAAVKDVMTTIATALRVAVSVTLLAGVLVLTSALTAALEQRMYDIAVFKALGARRADIIKSGLAEWTLLALSVALVAGAIGTLGAYFAGNYIKTSTFDPMPEVIIGVTLAGIGLMWVIGFIGNRRVFGVRPGSVLRNT